MSFLTSRVQSTEKNKKTQLLKQGVPPPPDELFYNKLPAGVRKPETNGFWLPQKAHTKQGLLLKSLQRETVTHTQPFAHVLAFIWSHFSPLLHLLPAFSMENGFHPRAKHSPPPANPCLRLVWSRKSDASIIRGRLGRGCSLGPEMEPSFFTIRCVMLRVGRTAQNQNK